MSSNGQGVEQEEFRIVMALPRSLTVLAEDCSGTLKLPRVNITPRTRTAQQLTETLQKRWDVRSIVIDFLQNSNELPRCAVMEIRTRDCRSILAAFKSVDVDELDEQELTETERLAVKDIISGETRDRGPFSKLGWIEEAQSWIRESVADHLIAFDDNLLQLAAGGFVALIRFGTVDGPAYWLKATSAPNAHEFRVTQTIARFCSQFLPPLIAARTDWNAWVTEDAGNPIHDKRSLHALGQATHCLAELQLACVMHVEELLICGCVDLRMSVLRAHLPKLTHYLEAAMASQTSTKVLPLCCERLCELSCLLQAATVAMEATGIPDTLIHNDMNPANILLDRARVVFTDWSEACIGAPFLTFQHLQVQASEVDETHTWTPRLKRIYEGHWLSCLSESQIEKGFALSPPLAIASYLCGRDPSFTSAHRSNDAAQGYARSLARHMDRCARSPEFLEALCR